MTQLLEAPAESAVSTPPGDAGRQRPSSRAPDAADWMAGGAGVLSMVLGLAVLAGWHLGSTALTQVYPGLAPMSYNTALCFVLLGGALLGLACGRRMIIRVVAPVTGLLMLASLLEDATGWRLNAAGWLAAMFLPGEGALPPLVAPNTACAMISLALGMVLLTQSARWRRRGPATALFGAAGLALGANALAGYLTGFQTFEWGKFQSMALHTSLGLIGLGAGVLALSWRGTEGAGQRTSWWLVLAAMAGVVTSVSLWQALISAEHQRVQSAMPEVVLWFGLIVTGLLLVALYLARTAHGRAVVAERMRRELETEVTQRKLAETAVQAERQRFGDMLDILPAYVVLLAPDYHVPFANRYFRERFGESHGRRCFEYLFGRTEPCEYCESYTVLQTRAPHSWEWTGPDGCNYDVYDFPFQDAGGSTLIFEMGIDVTARKRAENRLRQQAALLDLAHDAIFVRDDDSRVQFWNRGAEETYGWTAAEATGQVTHALLQTRFPIPLDEIEAITRTQGRWQGEMEHVTRDGRSLVIESRWSPRFDGKGTAEGFLEVNRDVTARKRAEEALEQKARDLARSNADLEQFAYVSSHDLQEPLRMVANFTQLLGERYGDRLGPDGAEFIAFAVDGATRMQRLIDDLLAYSRVGTRGRGFEPTDCNEVLGQAVANLQAAIQETGALVRHDELPTVMADPSQLTQLFQNLVSNAIKFRGPAPPVVQISAAPRDGEWLFSVRDNGIGIDAKFGDRIFVIFQRLHSREEYPGTGIGLAVCKKIVERHRGRIWVESEAGKGATFYFTIPV